MASIRFRNGRYHAQIRRRGYPQQTKSFITKRDATAWARQAETQLDQGKGVITARSNIILGDLIKRYRDTISPTKKSCAKETYRLNKLLTYSIAQTKLSDLSPSLFAQFRDRRLKDGQRTCRYDLVLLQHILKLARQEWGVPLSSNPVELIKKPPPSKPRDRRLEPGEFERLRDAAQASKATYLWPLVELAIETGMRRGELLKVVWADLELVAHLAQPEGPGRRPPQCRRSGRHGLPGHRDRGRRARQPGIHDGGRAQRHRRHGVCFPGSHLGSSHRKPGAPATAAKR